MIRNLDTEVVITCTRIHSSKTSNKYVHDVTGNMCLTKWIRLLRLLRLSINCILSVRPAYNNVRCISNILKNHKVRWSCRVINQYLLFSPGLFQNGDYFLCIYHIIILYMFLFCCSVTSLDQSNIYTLLMIQCKPIAAKVGRQQCLFCLQELNRGEPPKTKTIWKCFWGEKIYTLSVRLSRSL